MQNATQSQPRDVAVYLIGSGIAALASAYYLINDAGIAGEKIYLFEQNAVTGGACDGSGNPGEGYVIRGGRMHEEHYVCYWDLLANIPSYDDPAVSVKEESFAFSQRFVTDAKARLLKAGRILDASAFGLSWKDKMDLLRLVLTSESQLDNQRIQDWFQANFFATHFWLLWTSMFAFQRWSSLAEMRRYLRRFVHLVGGMSRLGGIMRTKYNQYHSVIVPLQRYLQQRGVHFELDTQVVDIDFECTAQKKTAMALYSVNKAGAQNTVNLRANDYVFITNGSIVDSAACGSWIAAPQLKDKSTSGSWLLWDRIARKDRTFGQPGVFSAHIDLQKWFSFTATLQDATFHDYMRTFSGNEAGTGGLVTFTDSNWLISIVIAHQPHFPDQPEDIKIFWGYGLYPDREGNYIAKKMSACSGEEIMQEIWYHLKILHLMQPVAAAGKINCIPVAMPFINSAFMPRQQGDRPQVISPGAVNFAFIGQFAELPDECAFTVEYSIRSAQTAVYRLFETGKNILPIHDSMHRPDVLIKAFRAINH